MVEDVNSRQGLLSEKRHRLKTAKKNHQQLELRVTVIQKLDKIHRKELGYLTS